MNATLTLNSGALSLPSDELSAVALIQTLTTAATLGLTVLTLLALLA